MGPYDLSLYLPGSRGRLKCAKPRSQSECCHQGNTENTANPWCFPKAHGSHTDHLLGRGGLSGSADRRNNGIGRVPRLHETVDDPPKAMR